jgi:hypothetical protein
MDVERNVGWCRGAVVAAALVFAGLTGCGFQGAPQPPSLNLPYRVTDLSAVRTGNQVTLTWTMPKKNTDKLLLKADVPVRVCRRETSTGPCVTAGTAQFAPGADASFTDTLPAALAAGAPRAVTYFVELQNRKGRSAGLSNDADIAAGASPAAVTDLSAEVAKTGVLLRWAKSESSGESAGMAVRLERTLLTPQPKQKKDEKSPIAPPPEPVNRTLLVTAGVEQGRALDRDIRFGETYEYRAQRVASVTANGQKLELAGPLSAPVRIDAVNIFPPDVPTGLAAVATAGENGAGQAAGQAAGHAAGPAIDLSWTPDTEADLAGYIVYRRENDGAWQRISPAQPVVGPGYRDDTVQPGHTYDYAVSAIDAEGHESERSVEAQETVPAS